MRGIQPSDHPACRGGRGPSQGSARTEAEGRLAPPRKALRAHGGTRVQPSPPGSAARSDGHGRGGASAGRGQISLISRGHHPAQTEVEDESHCQAVHGSSGPRYCGGGAPAPRHTRARQPGARGRGRPDGSPDADGPTPVLAESLVHGGRTPVAARATSLGVTWDLARVGPGARAPIHRITRERVSAPGATRTAVLREYSVASEEVVSRPNGRASWLSKAFAYVATLPVSASKKTARQRSREARP